MADWTAELWKGLQIVLLFAVILSFFRLNRSASRYLRLALQESAAGPRARLLLPLALADRHLTPAGRAYRNRSLLHYLLLALLAVPGVLFIDYFLNQAAPG